MLKIRIQYLLMLVFLVVGCTTTKVPAAYKSGLSKVEKSVYGSWTNTTLKQADTLMLAQVVEGELIAVQDETFFILTLNNEIIEVRTSDIEYASLFIYRTQESTYILISLLLYIPSIIGAMSLQTPAFLLFGLPGLVTGIVFSSIEGSSTNNELLYPGQNKLADFKPFARFPQGIPENLDLSELKINTKNK